MIDRQSWDPEFGPRRRPGRRLLRTYVKRGLARLRSLGRSAADPSRGVAILAYHGTGRPGERWWLDFHGQMSLIEDLGYRVVTLAEAVRLVRSGRPPARPTLAITFDDGFANNLDVAFPELAQRGWPATVFIATSYLGHRPYMQPTDVRRLKELGIQVGNHTHNHPDVTAIAGEELLREVHQCRLRLLDLCGEEAPHFCYPYGRYNERARRALASPGSTIDAACSGRVGFNGTAGDPFVLRRLTMERGEGPGELKVRLAGGYDFLDRRLERKHTA